MNILHVFRAPVGGLFRHVVDLARGQTARGHRVGLIADSRSGNTRTDGIFAELGPELALGITRIPMQRQPGPSDAFGTWQVSRHIARTGADIVHGHGAKGGAFSRLAFGRKGLVRAYTPHGGSLLFGHDTLSGKIYLTLERILMRRGQLYLFESAFSRNMFATKIGNAPGTVRIVHNGVSQAEFEPVALAPDATDIVFLGELRHLKGIDVLLDAIAALRDAGRRLTVTLVGDGDFGAELHAQVERLGLQTAVRFRSAMPARAAFALGRVMVVPSRFESLPYVLLEAAAAAKPLIATRVGGIPEIYGPMADRLIPPGDSAALAGALAAAIDEPTAADTAAQALRDRVAGAFSVDTMVEGVLAGYRQALGAIEATPR